MIESILKGRGYYEPGNAVYISNLKQARKYVDKLGADSVLDVILDSQIKEDSIIFVFPKNEETRQCKLMWDNHEL